MRKLYLKRRLPRGQLFIATVFGVFGGVYIWLPVFREAKSVEIDKTKVESCTEKDDSKILAGLK